MSGAGLRIAMVGPIDIALLRRLQAPGMPPAGGVGNQGAVVLSTLIDALARSGIAVTGVTTNTLSNSITHEILNDLVDLVIVPQRARGYGRDFMRQERLALTAAIEPLQVDLVHAHWTYEYALAALLGQSRPVLVSVHDWAPAIFRHNPHPYNVARVVVQRRVLRRSSHVTANSPYIAEQLTRMGCQPFMLPNPISAERFVDRSHRVSKDAPLIVAINNGFAGRKNVASLITAFGLVRSHFPNARLALIGAGHEPGGAAEQWAGSRGLLENVEFVGRIDDVAVDKWLSIASIFVHPSREESFGAVLLEAMAARVPVIAGSRSGAVPWVVGDAGILCDVTNPAALGNAIASVLGSDQLQRELADRGYQNAWERFHADGVARTAVAIYEQILDRVAAP